MVVFSVNWCAQMGNTGKLTSFSSLASCKPVPCFCAMFSSKIPQNPDTLKQTPFNYQLLTKYTTIFITLRSGVQFPLSLHKIKKSSVMMTFLI